MKNQAIEKAIAVCGSQTKLSKACGVSQVAIYYWLNGGGINAKYIPSIVKATKGKVTEKEILGALSLVRNHSTLPTQKQNHKTP